MTAEKQVESIEARRDRFIKAGYEEKFIRIDNVERLLNFEKTYGELIDKGEVSSRVVAGGYSILVKASDSKK